MMRTASQLRHFPTMRASATTTRLLEVVNQAIEAIARSLNGF